MFFQTRLSRYLGKFLYSLKDKVLNLQTSLSFILFSLFTGFIIGNLFGTFLDTLRLYFVWNGFVGLVLIFCIEALNSLVYGISLTKKSNFQQNNVKHSCRKNRIQNNKQSLIVNSTANQLTSILDQKSLYASNDQLGWSKKQAKSKIKLLNISIFKRLDKDFSSFFSNRVTDTKRALNSFKIGLLFGFFVDSFKVGS